MLTKRMGFNIAKAVIVILMFCFAMVQLASLNKKAATGNDKRQQDNLAKLQVKKDDSGEVKKMVESDKLSVEKSPDDSNNAPVNPVIAAVDSNNNADNMQPLDVKADARQVEEKAAVGVEHVGKVIEEDSQREPQLENPKDVLPPEDLKANANDENLGEDADLNNDEHQEEKDDDVDPAEKKEEGGDEDDYDDGDEEEEDDIPAHKLVNVKKLPLDEIQPPDHMDAVKLEHDGHLNREFKKEIFLGNHEEFDSQPDMDTDEVLENVFNKVDEDEDNFITLAELEKWIVAKVKEHLLEASQEAERIFKHLDAEGKGAITWQDFHIHFLVAKGYDLKTALKQSTDYDTIPLDPDEKERLIRYKFRWAEADEEPQDNKLTMEEFKSFRHPEQSSLMINRIVQDIVENLDTNQDGELTEEEFVALPPGEVDSQFAESDKAWQEDRRKEFRNVIDLNHDGKITREEIKNYVDPLNPNNGRLEAENLILLADQDGDSKLTLDEVLDNSELFLGSKMVNTGKNFHDEF